MKYRPDIDGLRAIAVLSVVAFHYGALVPGGFVGVDIFFVISGYLITGQIAQNLRDGSFTFGGFYLRRARRILPALLVTLALSFAAALPIMPPEQLQDLSKSLVAAILSVSNIYFKRTAGYFDAAAETKPLLHTWSLGVEEQFYLFFPLAMYLAWRASRRYGLPLLVVGVGLVSFTLNFTFKVGPASIFYLAPHRAFEFAIGAAVVWLPRSDRASINLSLSAIGLALIAYSIGTFTDKLAYPAAYMLVPCTGAAFVILARSDNRLNVALSNRLMVHVGIISYSLYLVHWPLIVFAQDLFRPLTASKLVIIAVAALLCAEIMYRYIEKPFRTGGLLSTRMPVLGGGAAVALLLLSYSAINTGWVWRLPKEYQSIAAETQKTNPEMVGSIGCQGPCEFGNKQGPKILLVGDSHLDQYTKAINNRAGDKYHFFLAYSPSCFFGATMASISTPGLGPPCRAANAKLREWLSTEKFQAIVVAERWSGYTRILTRGDELLRIDDHRILYPAMLEDIFALYRPYDVPIVFLAHAPNTTVNCYLRPATSARECRRAAPTEQTEFKTIFDDFVKSRQITAPLINPADAICPNNICQISNEAGHPLYSDEIHLSVYGAEMVVLEIMNVIEKKLAAAP